MKDQTRTFCVEKSFNLTQSTMPLSQQYKDSALINALINEWPQKVFDLLIEGANPDARGGDFNIPALELALLQPPKARASCIQALMSHGADPNLIDRQLNRQMSPFMRACMRGDEKSINAMMNSAGPVPVDLLVADEHGWLASFPVASGCSVQMMEHMQAYFERVHWPSYPQLDRGHLWISCALEEQSATGLISESDNFRWILSQNFRDRAELVESAYRDGRTSLWRAASSNDLNLVNFLLSVGARTDVVNSSGKTLLCQAKNNAVGFSEVSIQAKIFQALDAVHASRVALNCIDEMLSGRLHVRL